MVKFIIISFWCSQKEQTKGKIENETSDEIHGKHHGDAMVKRMHGHGDQTLEWWALYVGKKERSLLSMYE